MLRHCRVIDWLLYRLLTEEEYRAHKEKQELDNMVCEIQKRAARWKCTMR